MLCRVPERLTILTISACSPFPCSAFRTRAAARPSSGHGRKQWPSWVTPYPIELPGREHRLSDPAFRHVAPLVAALLHDLAPYVHRPFVFYGHSMGALIAFELARSLQATTAFNQAIFSFPPASPPSSLRRPPIHTLPDAAFIREMRRINGTPAEVLDCNELMDLMLPTLRADFTFARPTFTGRVRRSGARQRLRRRRRLIGASGRPIGLAGTHTGSFAVRFMAGGHFFPHQEGDALLNAMFVRSTAHYVGVAERRRRPAAVARGGCGRSAGRTGGQSVSGVSVVVCAGAAVVPASAGA